MRSGHTHADHLRVLCPQTLEVFAVLMGVGGDLGAGKTLTMTRMLFLGWLAGSRIYTNKVLYGIPFIPLVSSDGIEHMNAGIFGADELWSYIDSREWMKNKNKATTTVLLKSRHHGITIIYTAQRLGQVEKRIRDITNISSFPELTGSWCKVSNFSHGQKLNPEYFRAVPIYALYDHTEDAPPLEDFGTHHREVFHHIRDNPAWKKFCEKQHIGKGDFLKVSDTMEKGIASMRVSLPKADDSTSGIEQTE